MGHWPAQEEAALAGDSRGDSALWGQENGCDRAHQTPKSSAASGRADRPWSEGHLQAQVGTIQEGEVQTQNPFEGYRAGAATSKDDDEERSGTASNEAVTPSHAASRASQSLRPGHTTSKFVNNDPRASPFLEEHFPEVPGLSMK